MENDIISLFLNRKKTNISRCTELFIKYNLDEKIKGNKIINKIIEIYTSKFYLKDKEDYSILKKYFKTNEEDDNIMKDILSSSVLFYLNSGLENQIKDDIQTIIMLSDLIYLAVSVDLYTNEFFHKKESIEKRIKNFLDAFQNKINIKPENFLDFTEELSSYVRKDVHAEKKFWNYLVSNNYFLSYKQCMKNNDYYLVDYNYDIKMLYRYHQDEIDKVVLTKGINDDILTIYLELLCIFILKNLLNQKDYYYFINIPIDYFDKNKNILNIEAIYSKDISKKHLIFLFDYSKAKENMSAIKTIKAKNFKVAVRNIKEKDKISNHSFDLFDFVYIDSAIYNKYKDLHDIWKVKEINFLFDADNFLVTKEEDILKDR